MSKAAFVDVGTRRGPGKHVLGIFAKCLIPLLLMPCCAMSSDAQADSFVHTVNEADQRAIARVLDSYTRAVSNGDEAAFSKLLLNENIPFFCTDDLAQSPAKQQPLDVRQYKGFRDAVFRSHAHLAQHFAHVHIEQDGDLAAVSLDFFTLKAGTNRGSYGFKTLQLIKVAGTWKIASEFYSAYAMK